MTQAADAIDTILQRPETEHARRWGRLACVVCVFLAACGGGGGGGSAGGTGDSAPTPPPVASPGSPPASCTVEDQIAFVQAVADDWYLWYDELAVLNPAAFTSAEAYLSALTAPLAEDFRDPGFSFLTTRAQDEANLTSRAFVGFGFRFAIDAQGRYLISDTFEETPAARAGFRRGAQILAVDAGDGFVSMEDFEAQGASLEAVFGGPIVGLERGFRLRVDGEVIETRAAKADLAVPPLAAAPLVLAREGLDPVGYVHLRGFTRSATPALDGAFEELANQDVRDLIIDLRYNSGGLVDVSAQLMDLLGGTAAEGDVAYSLSHNEKRASQNADFLFQPRPASITPLRVAFITSEATASASEVVINSLAPVLEVALVGSDTSGKAVGQYAFDLNGCDTRLRLVSFESLNGEGQGEFYTGLVDTGRFTLCDVEDTFTGAFGSAADPLTAGAIAWLNEGVCPRSQANAEAPPAAGLRRAGSPVQGASLPDRRSTWVQ